MNAKTRNTLDDLDKVFEGLPASELSPDVVAELERLRARGRYLRSDAYHLRLKLFSTLWATAAGIVIMLGVKGLCYVAGMSPAKLFKGFYMGSAAIAFFLLRSLWEMKKEQKAIDNPAKRDSEA